MRRRVELDQDVIDWVVAGGLAIWGQVDQWLAGETLTRVHGSAGTAVPFLLLVSLPLGVRRRWPLGVLCVVMGAIALDSAVVGQAAQGALLLFPMLIVLYTVAAHCELWRALLGAAVAFAGYTVESGLDREVATVGDLVVVEGFFFVFLGGCAWVTGRYARSRRLEARRSEDRADRAERDGAERARLAVSLERDRIARELHDVIAHSVSLMGIQAGAAERVLQRDPGRAIDAMRSIQATARESVGELRRLLGILHADPSTSERAPQPDLDALDQLVEQTRATGTVVEFFVEGSRRHLPPGIELSAYRIVQEGLTNARKHAPGARTEVHVIYRRELLELRVENDAASRSNGDGALGTGSGIIGMRERVVLYGGTLDATRRRDGGFCVHAVLPIETAP
jgi:signal transduction histidine kinase